MIKRLLKFIISKFKKKIDPDEELYGDRRFNFVYPITMNKKLHLFHMGDIMIHDEKDYIFIGYIYNNESIPRINCIYVFDDKVKRKTVSNSMIDKELINSFKYPSNHSFDNRPDIEPYISNERLRELSKWLGFDMDDFLAKSEKTKLQIISDIIK